MEHDKSKQICLDLEFESDDSQNIDTKIFNIVNPCKEIICGDYPIHADFRNALQERKEKIREICFQYKYDDDKTDKWCKKCFTYANGIHNNKIDSIDIQHSYSNPIWRSDWNIKDLYMGSSTTSFMRRFSKDRQYREIFDDDVNEAYKRIENIGIPIRDSDVEAKKETLEVLDFLKKYTGMSDVHIIIEDEY
jgi:hypothetical protein